MREDFVEAGVCTNLVLLQHEQRFQRTSTSSPGCAWKTGCVCVCVCIRPCPNEFAFRMILFAYFFERMLLAYLLLFFGV